MKGTFGEGGGVRSLESVQFVFKKAFDVAMQFRLHVFDCNIAALGKGSVRLIFRELFTASEGKPKLG